MRQRIWSALLALAMLLTALPGSALAASSGGGMDYEGEELISIQLTEEEIAEYDELLEYRLMQMLAGEDYGISTYSVSNPARNQLSEDAKKVYDAVVEKLPDILENGGYTEFAVENLPNGITTDERKAVFNALCFDRPYEMYWRGLRYGSARVGNTYYLYIAVSADYRATDNDFSDAPIKSDWFTDGFDHSPYKVDAAKAKAASDMITNAQGNAQTILTTASKLSTGLEKLVYFKEAICALVAYNTPAASWSNDKYGDPWQLIYVFDGDAQTDVVCEGYSKAFQYLCDMSGLDCYTVSGDMNGGAHMWNIVTFGGENYLVDVTNCDGITVTDTGVSRSSGYPYGLFLAGASGSPENGYTVNTSRTPYKYLKVTVTNSSYSSVPASGKDIKYTYDNESVLVWPSSGVLTLSDTSYPIDFYNIPQTELYAGTTYKWDAQFTQGFTFSAVTEITSSSFALPTGMSLDSAGTITYTPATVKNSADVTIAIKYTDNTDELPYYYTFTLPAVVQNKTEPKCDPPINLTAIAGSTLSTVTLTNPDGNTAGTWSWVNPSQSVGSTVGPQTFQATFTPTDTANFQTVTVDVTVTVTKPLTHNDVKVTVSPTEITYGGTQPTVTVTDGTAALAENTHYTVEYPTNTDVGNKTITIKGQDGSYYTGQTTASYKIIAAALTNVTVSGTTAVTVGTTYANAIGNLTAVGTGVSNEAVNGTLTWYTDSGRTQAADNGTFNNAGTTTLYWTFTPDSGNYNPYEGSTQFNVSTKRPLTVTVTDPGAKTYGDVAFTLSVTVQAGDMTDNAAALSYAITQGTDVVSVDDNGQVTIKKAGTATVTVTATPSSSYSGEFAETTATVTIAVAKKSVDATVTAEDKTYDGNTTATVKAEVTSGLVSGDSITIIGLTGTFSDANAGDSKTVTVDTSKAVVTGTNAENYEITYHTGNVTATISKANQTAPAAPTATDANTTDTSITLTTIEGAEYKMGEGDTWQQSPAFTGLTANTEYTFYARLKEDNNHNVSPSSSAAKISTKKTSLSSATVTITGADSITYTGEVQTPDVTVELNGTTLNLTTDYTVSYSDNINAGTAKVTVNAAENGQYSGTVEETFTIRPKSISEAAIDSIADQTYTGDGIKPGVTIKDGSTVLKENTDYTLTYSNNTNVTESASVEIKGMGNYTGTKTATFKITQKALTSQNVDADLQAVSGRTAKVNLSVLIPTDCGTGAITYEIASDSSPAHAKASIDKGLLTLTYQAVDTDTEGVAPASETLTVTVSGMQNYSDLTITVTIKYTIKEVVTLTISGLENLTYDGKAKEATVTGAPEGVALTYVYTGTTAKGDIYNSGQVPINAGTYTVTVSIPDANEDYAGTVTASFTIAKAVATITAEDKSVSVGTPPTYTYTVAPTGTDLGITPTFTCDYPEISNTQGKYVIHVSGADTSTDGNYSITYKEGTLTVNAAVATVATPIASLGGGTYTSAQSVTLSCATEGAEIYYTTNGSEPTASSTKYTGAIAVSSTTTIKAIAVKEGQSSAVMSVTYTIQTSSGSGSTGGSSAGTSGIGTGGGGNGTTAATSSVTVTNPSTANGTVSANISAAKKGDTVKVISSAKSGYISAAPIVKDKNGNIVAVTKNADGTYSFTMPEGGVTITGSYVTPGQIFNDVSDSAWYRDELAYVVENGLMSGVGNQQFNPSATTTRGMIMTILARQFGIDTTTTGSEPWYQKGMEWAKKVGISDGTNPGGSITREQLATMLYRFIGEPAVTGDLSTYPDADNIHGWSSDAMVWAVKTGIIEGSDGKLNPQGNASRVEAAAMLMRFCQNMLGLE